MCERGMFLLSDTADNAIDSNVLPFRTRGDGCWLPEQLRSSVKWPRDPGLCDVFDAWVCGAILALAGSKMKKAGLDRRVPGQGAFGQTVLGSLTSINEPPCSP